jgi:hypothetical protein
MNLALILLKTGQSLVSQTEELEYEPKVHLYQPYLVSGKTKVTLTPWPDYVIDEHILLSSDTLLTVGEPTAKIKKAYLDKIGKTEEELKPKPQPVILTEEEQLPDLDDDDYEPEYVEM